jgi:hypothetical protein
MEGLGLAVELFILIFSFLCWLVTPPMLGEKGLEVNIINEISTKVEAEDEVDTRKGTLVQVVSVGGELSEGLNEKDEIEIAIYCLNTEETRRIAKVLGVKLTERGRYKKTGKLQEELSECLRNGKKQELLQLLDEVVVID